MFCFCFFFSSRRRHTRCSRDWSSDVCSSDLRLTLERRRPETHRAVPARRVDQPEIRVELLAGALVGHLERVVEQRLDRKSTRLNSSHSYISYAVFCLKKKKNTSHPEQRTSATAVHHE